MHRQSLEGFRSRIKPKHLVSQAVRRNHIAVFANDQIVEAMLRRILRLEASQQLSSGIKMQELRPPAVRVGISPNGPVVRVESDAQHWQESEAICRHEIGNVTVAADLHNLPAIETAQVENIPPRIV